MQEKEPKENCYLEKEPGFYTEMFALPGIPRLFWRAIHVKTETVAVGNTELEALERLRDKLKELEKRGQNGAI